MAGFKKELIAPGFASDFGVLAVLLSQTGGNYKWHCNVNSKHHRIYAAQNFTFGPVSGFVK